VTQSKRPCVGGFASLALEGHIKFFFFFSWEFPDLVKESGGGNQSSEFEIFKIRHMEV